MPWFKVDDTLAMHPKVVGAGNAAMGLWVRAGSWSAQQLTEGRVPRAMLPVLGGRARDAAALVDTGLWVTTDDGWAFHQWDERQPSREKVESERAAAAQRQRDARERAKSRREAEQNARASQRDSRRDSQRDGGVSHGPPDPTRPDPTKYMPPAGPADADAPPPATTQTLIAEWIDHCGNRPPNDVVGQVSKRVAKMLDEGIPYADIRRGLAAWQAKGLHPSALPSVVHETRTPRTRTATSTTDQRVADALALRNELRDEAATVHRPPALGA